MQMTYEELKQKAKDIGVEFKGQIARDELEALVAAKEEEIIMAEKAATYEKPNEVTKAVVSEASKKVNARQEALLMKKVKITPLDERLRGIPSEYFSTGNKHIGFISKVVRFNVPTWEPQAILNILREKQMLIQETATVNGKEVVRKRLTEAYAIVEVPLTAEEEEELAASKK